MKTFTSLIAFMLLLACNNACAQRSYYDNSHDESGIKASKNYVTKEIRVEEFTKLSVSGGADVFFTQRSGKPKVTLYTSDNLVERVQIEVKGSTLQIGFKRNTRIRSYDKLEVRIEAETLEMVNINGSGSLLLKNGLKGDRLVLNVAGSGDIKGDCIYCAENLTFSIAGSGDVNCNDLRADHLKLSVAGSGDVNCRNLQSRNLGISIAGSGDIKASEVKTDNLNCSIGGSGTITLSGNTREAEYSVAGSGDIRASNLVADRASASATGSGSIQCHATDFLKIRTTGSGSVGYKGDPQLDIPRKNIYKLD